MTTGVDAQTCKLIVLDQHIQSMTEFKQIIGRGTRINEDHGKFWFTIMDFKKATELFADPAFDGDPVAVFEPGPGDPVTPPDEPPAGMPDGSGPAAPSPSPDGGFPDGGDGDGTGAGAGEGRRVKYRVGADQVSVQIVAERVQYYGSDGRLVTESLRDYTRSCVKKQFASLDDFLRRWNDAEQKKAVIDELAAQGVIWEALQEDVAAKGGGTALDPFDLVCHVAFDRPPLTRRERADSVRKRDYFARYQGTARQVLEALLDKYADTGVEPIEDLKILQMPPFSQIGAPLELVGAFGGKKQYTQAIQDLEVQLYA